MTAKQPNIPLITSNQQRFDTVGPRKPAWLRTPHLDRLGLEGVRFDFANPDLHVEAPFICYDRGLDLGRPRNRATVVRAGCLRLRPRTPLFALIERLVVIAMTVTLGQLACHGEPPKDGLQLWLKPESLGALKTGDRIMKWTDASGKGNDATALNEKTAPVVGEWNDKKARALGQEGDKAAGELEGTARPDLRVAQFQGKDVPGGYSKEYHLLRLPIAEEWGAITMIAVGNGLGKSGLIDTAPWENGCLRTVFGVQLCGAKLNIASPFPGLKNPGIVAIRISRDTTATATIKSYVNGKETGSFTQPASESPARTIWFKNAGIGAGNWRQNGDGEVECALQGDIAEMFLYDRALTDAELQELILSLAKKYTIAETQQEKQP